MTVAARSAGDAPEPPAYAQALRDLLVTADRGNTTDAVTEALREAILSGVVSAPAWLREDELAAALQVSRTPIREALRRLSDEGLTERVANRGTVYLMGMVSRAQAGMATELARTTSGTRRVVKLFEYQD